MSFRVLAFVMTVGGCLLGIRFLFAGGSVLHEWGVEPTAGALVACRRLGAVYLGVALAFFLGRAAPPSDIRSAVCLVTGGAVALLAGLGLVDFSAHRVGAGVLRSVVAEVALAAAFVFAWWRGR